MALILAMVLGVLTGAQEPFNDFTVLAFITFGGGAAALSARAVRRRSQTWIFIALITLGNTLGIAAFGLMGDLEHEYRRCQINTFGGGINELQRGLVANFGLNMPRHR